MDMASASSIVTDSAAASSSWGGGFRVNNGSLNISPSGEEHLPIWQKFKLKGKKAGCVTTVPITHATPAGFTVAIKSRNNQSAIAEEYLRIGYDVLLGGGQRYFAAEHRKDKKDMYQAFEKQNYVVADRKSTRLNSSHVRISYAVFCLKKKRCGGLVTEAWRRQDRVDRTGGPGQGDLPAHPDGSLRPGHLYAPRPGARRRTGRAGRVVG